MSTHAFQKIAVIGLGKVGRLVAKLLHRTGFQVTGYDMAEKSGFAFPVHSLDIDSQPALQKALAGQEAVVSALPYALNINLAKAAHKAGIHYFDLTEDVPTTNAIRIMAEKSKGVMAPQCGLAPGLIGIIGAHLAAPFERLRSIELRVGALPQHPKGLLGYAFNWSAEGVVNEYLNDCEVIQDGHRKMVPPMQDLETIVIGGRTLEAFTTSGGLGTMCETYEGQVEDLNYKTMRYPGHCQLMRFFFHELRMRDRREEAGKILLNAKPPVVDDAVYIHAAVEGWQGERLIRDEYVRRYLPTIIDGESWRAISWTTAASACAVIEMVAAGTLPNHGFIKQEAIPLPDLLATRNGNLFTHATTTM